MSHYGQRLQKDLDVLSGEVRKVGDAVRIAVADATRAFLTLDLKLAYRTIINDHPVNRMTRRIDRLCHAFVARHVPSAGHLRFVSAVMRMNVALERVGDYAVTMCREAAQMKEPAPAGLAKDLDRLSDLSQRVLEQALNAFLERDVALARATMDLSDQMGYSLNQLFNKLIREGELKRRHIEDMFGLLVSLYRIERVGDQAKNVCEEAIFVATGESKESKVYHILFVDQGNHLWSQMAEALARKSFPESGVYASAGWEPAGEVEPAVKAFLDERGHDLRAAWPTQLSTDHAELSRYHLIVGLQGKLRERIPEPPFRTVLLDWDVVEDPEALDDVALEAVYEKLADELAGLMDVLRGEEAC